MNESNGLDAGHPMRDYARILWRWRWHIASLMTLIVVGTAIFSYETPPVYEASAKLLVEKSRLNLNVTELITPLGTGPRYDIENRIQVIVSEPLLQRALEQLAKDEEYLGLRKTSLNRDSVLRLFTQWFDREHSAGTGLLPTPEELRANLTVRSVPSTDIIEVHARAGSPREAQIVTNAIVQMYINHDVETAKAIISKVITSFLEPQVKKTRSQLEAIEQQAVEYQFKKTSGLELGPEGAAKNILELQRLYLIADVELKDTMGKLEALNKVLAEVKQDLLARVSDTSQVNVILEAEDKLTQIKKTQQEIRQLEQKRQAYLDSKDYLQAQQVREEILKKQQAIQTAATTQFPALELFPKYDELIKKQLEFSLQIEALRNRTEVVRALIESQTDMLADHGLELLRLQRNLDVDKAVYVQLLQEYQKSLIAEAGQLGTVRVVHLAIAPESPIMPRMGLNIFIGALVGLVLGIGVALLFEHLDNTYMTAKEIEREHGTTTLGTIPILPSEKRNGSSAGLLSTILLDHNAKDPLFTAYLTIEANLRFSALAPSEHSLLVTSSLPGEGKSTTALNLAIVMSSMGQKVLLIDGDLRKPMVTQLFGARGAKGLSDLLREEASLKEVIQHLGAQSDLLEHNLTDVLIARGHLTRKQIEQAMAPYRQTWQRQSLGEILVHDEWLEAEAVETILAARRKKFENLHFIPAGSLPPNPTALLGSVQLEKILSVLKKRFDWVLIDSPPVMVVPDASLVSAKVDGTVLVIEAERTDRVAVCRTIEQLKRTRARLVGFILNKVQKQAARYYGSYYGYYDYGQEYGRNGNGSVSRKHVSLLQELKPLQPATKPLAHSRRSNLKTTERTKVDKS